MTPQSFLLSPELAEFVRASADPPDDVVTDLVAETAAMTAAGDGKPTYQVATEQAAFLTLLTRVARARWAIEIGTFTGLSALAIARGLPDDGGLLCLDRDAHWTDVARRYWGRAGVADRVELRLGEAAELLAQLPRRPTFDLAFVDADKTGYAGYVDALHPRMHPGGLLVLDNTLRAGKVLDPQDDDDRAIAALAASLAADDRFDTVLLPVADGLTLLRVR
ncbi:caffeoyl-CoA O-methyltransferase [Klenkia marina]|uniref:Caffeoyl-CoA O-methyltransferase n=1 Tax=Klenkia marina TaxID=1960309 RepID=A0A1G4XFV8_9ACTN|nr:O-methyltransferase [Klenkia marina]SCX39924.1 caffeoyl-CoA O-methyltransferase [Klenkia marina]